MEILVGFVILNFHLIRLKDYIAYWQSRIDASQFMPQEISGLLKEVLVKVFEAGLREDEHYLVMGEISLEKVKAERAGISDASLEAQLLDLLIDECRGEDWEP